jgi:ABC-type Fe3+/spermidine/putrescine transport system ATPase subunit
MVRGDDVRIEPAEDGDADGVIESVEFLGGFYRYSVRLQTDELIHSLMTHADRFSQGATVKVTLDPGHELIGFPRNGHSDRETSQTAATT